MVRSPTSLALTTGHSCRLGIQLTSLISFVQAVAATEIEKVSILGSDTIHLGFHLIPYIASTVVNSLPASNYVLFTDSNLAPKFLDTFQAAFTQVISAAAGEQANARFLSHVIAPGEQSKSRETKAALEDFMLSHRCTRDTVVLALGGGVVGDLVGFVAANFMRGIRYVQIPTTLLAMVDSAVGGKVSSIRTGWVHPALRVLTLLPPPRRPRSTLLSART